jgi:hypothetical protein
MSNRHPLRAGAPCFGQSPSPQSDQNLADQNLDQLRRPGSLRDGGVAGLDQLCAAMMLPSGRYLGRAEQKEIATGWAARRAATQARAGAGCAASGPGADLPDTAPGFLDHPEMPVSHETIYQELSVQSSIRTTPQQSAPYSSAPPRYGV